MEQEEVKIELRLLEESDFDNLIKAMKASYKDMPNFLWERKELELLIDLFPEGQISVWVNDVLAGCALSIIVDREKFSKPHTYLEVIDNGTFKTFDPKGTVLYGIDVFINPDFQGLKLGRRLYDARKELVERMNLYGIFLGGRLPKYNEYSKDLSPKEYIEKVKFSEILDPVLAFQLNNDFHVKRVLSAYLPEDEKSGTHAALLEWNNIYYAENATIDSTKSTVRLGLVQWQMRNYQSYEDFIEHITFFVDAMSGYHSDFILFPELFNAPLMAEFNHLEEAASIRELAKYTDKLVATFKELAVSYNINIITGSMPQEMGDELHNVSFLCRRDGTSESYSKIHITPNEKRYWGIHGGDKAGIFDTDCGKIGICICYDIEFPELARYYGENGVNMIFVPFLTDTQNGYSRVRRCAQARAIENECYVAIAGCVGNLPRVKNMDIQYAQSAVFTPSDFAFPNNAVKAETTPNTEMTLIVDVDIDQLKELHNYGSVQTLGDRRKDLYEVVWKGR